MFSDYKDEGIEKLKREIENNQDSESLVERLEKVQRSMNKLAKSLVHNEKKKHKKYID